MSKLDHSRPFARPTLISLSSGNKCAHRMLWNTSAGDRPSVAARLSARRRKPLFSAGNGPLSARQHYNAPLPRFELQDR